MNEQDLKKIFITHKVDICDDVFTQRVVSRLPERKSILPQIVMSVFVMIGLVITFAIQGVTPLLEQINSLITSVIQLQAPSLSSVITYFGALALMSIIGYSVAQADVG